MLYIEVSRSLVRTPVLLWNFMKIIFTNSGRIIRRTLFQNALSANPKVDVAMPMPSSEIIFWKRTLHTYVHTYAYIHMWKALYQNTILEFGFGITNSFSGMALNRFWKRALHILEYLATIHHYFVYSEQLIKSSRLLAFKSHIESIQWRPFCFSFTGTELWNRQECPLPEVDNHLGMTLDVTSM